MAGGFGACSYERRHWCSVLYDSVQVALTRTRATARLPPKTSMLFDPQPVLLSIDVLRVLRFTNYFDHEVHLFLLLIAEASKISMTPVMKT